MIILRQHTHTHTIVVVPPLFFLFFFFLLAYRRQSFLKKLVRRKIVFNRDKIHFVRTSKNRFDSEARKKQQENMPIYISFDISILSSLRQFSRLSSTYICRLCRFFSLSLSLLLIKISFC